MCSNCHKQRARASSKASYEKHRDAAREKMRIYQSLRPTEQRLLTSAKDRAPKKGVPFELTLEDIQVPVRCPVLGIQLSRTSQHHGYNDSSPSLDRLVPEKGYVKGNVRVISMRANRIKSNATASEVLAVALWMHSQGL